MASCLCLSSVAFMPSSLPVFLGDIVAEVNFALTPFNMGVNLTLAPSSLPAFLDGTVAKSNFASTPFSLFAISAS
eukprot:m.13485 g.13485  ORF g.13485 m.13485 type:complete len:75 (+) comp24858_c0_seq1:274-498(+)